MDQRHFEAIRDASSHTTGNQATAWLFVVDPSRSDLGAYAHAVQEGEGSNGIVTKKMKASSPQARSRRDEILAVAAGVIAERGLAGATVRDIGQAAGILSGSLYHHFESKEQIVLELLLTNVKASLERAESIIADAPNAETAMAELIRDSIAETARQPNESLILRNETRAFQDTAALAPLAELRQTSVALWVDAINRGVASGEFRSDLDAQVIAMAIVDSVLGTARWFRREDRKDPDQVASSIAALHLTGLAPT